MISIVINCDTRDGFDSKESSVEDMFKGTRSLDFLTDGVINKINFFKDHIKEVILFIDEHNPVPHRIIDQIRPFVDKLVISKHSKHYRGNEPFSGFNDINYLHALSLCRGDYVAHFDQDVAAFSSGPDVIDDLLAMLQTRNFVSLPSACSPDPVYDPSFGGKWWASTRFFMCNREKIDLTALEHAIRDYQWAYKTYGTPLRQHPWTEHFLTLIAGYSVHYPPIEIDRWAVFPWNRYKVGTLAKLNAMQYGEVASKLHPVGLPYDGVDASLLKL